MNRPEYRLAEGTLNASVGRRPAPTEDEPQGRCLDTGYDYTGIQDLLEPLGYPTQIRPRDGAPRVKDSPKKARRWAVERTQSWMDRFRALLLRWSKQADCSGNSFR